MIEYKEALAIAKSKKSRINHCIEYDNAYVFSYESNKEMVGGENPIAIIKETGEALNMISYATGYDHNLIREFNL